MRPRFPRRRVFEILLILLIATAAVWVIVLRRSRPTASTLPDVRLPSDFGEAAEIRFVVGTDTFRVEPRGDEFWLQRPFRERVDPLFLLEVERQAHEMKVSRALPDTGGAAFGLDPPCGSVRLLAASGVEWELQVGDEVPAGGQRYARLHRSGSPVVLLDGFITQKYFLPKFDELRDPVAASLGAGPPDSVAVLTPGRELRARRLSAERWVASKPRGLEVDPPSINAVIQLLRGPNIRGYPAATVPEDSLGLANPRAVWILCQAARRETVRVGRVTSDLAGIYIRPSRRSCAAILSSEQFRSLVDGWPGLADRHLLSLPKDSVRTIEFLGSRAAYRREGTGWIRGPDRHPIARVAALENDLGNLIQLQWQTWPIPPQNPPASVPRLRLSLAAAARAETVEIAGDNSHRAWARSTRRREWGFVAETTWTTWNYRAAHAE